MRNLLPRGVVTSADALSRLSRGSSEVHVAHRQPICGTPVDVPEPSIVIVYGITYSFYILKAVRRPSSKRRYMPLSYFHNSTMPPVEGT